MYVSKKRLEDPMCLCLCKYIRINVDSGKRISPLRFLFSSDFLDVRKYYKSYEKERIAFIEGTMAIRLRKLANFSMRPLCSVLYKSAV